MTFTQAVRSVLSNYAEFSGRARRSEYWWFYLFTVIVGAVTTGIDALLNLVFSNDFGVVNTLTSLALLLPTLAVTARRLHDTGRTGWWMLLPLAPLLATIVVGFAAVMAMFLSSNEDGVMALWALFAVCAILALAASITLIVFLCLDSTRGPNKYGPSPKQPFWPTGPGGHYPGPGYGPAYAPPAAGNPYGVPPQPPAPPAPGSWPMQR